MKKTWLLILPLIFLVSGCSSVSKTEPAAPDTTGLSNAATACVIPATTTEDISASTTKSILPPVSQEEVKKTFTYEDEDMGVKLKYPGSCYFNKGVFQCSDFTLSVWVLDSIAKPSSTPEKTFKDGQTQIKYVFIHGNKIYALMAWYDGQNRSDLEKVIDKIAKSLKFTR
ncbi:MAG: hypothetical protein WCK59_02665 [Candidatus Falkowbacteria bacterium]